MSPVAHEMVTWMPRVRVDKYDQDQTAWVRGRTGLFRPSGRVFEALGVKPAAVAESAGNLVTTAGLTRQQALLNGAGGQALTNTAVRIGVGNGAGTAAVGDSDLSAAAGAANRWFQVMDATYPSVAAAVLTARSTFASADGNFAWNEWGMDVGTPTVTSSAVVAALLFNHKTSAALGTKTAGATWTFTVTYTVS